MPRRSSRDPAFPAPGCRSYRDLVEFLRANPQALTAREIARAFGLGPADGPALRGLLRAIERSGEVVRGPDRKFAAGGALPEIAHIERAGSDSDGFPLVRPVAWSGEGEAPRFRLTARPTTSSAIGERALARLGARDSGEIEAEIIRRVARPDDAANRVVGVFRRTRDGGVIAAADRRDKQPNTASLGAGCGRTARQRAGRRRRAAVAPLRQAAPASSNGSARPDAPDAISRLTIAAFDIPAEFPAAALAEAERPARAPRDPRRTAAPICATSRWSRSTAGRARFRRRGLGRTRSGPGQSRRLAHRRRDRRCRGLCHGRAARSTARRRGAATRSISRTASCRCCPRRCRTICARCGRARIAPASRHVCGSIRRAASAGTVSSAAVMRSAARLTYEEVQAARDGRRLTAAARARAARRAVRRLRRSRPGPAGARRAGAGPRRAPGRARRRTAADRGRAARPARQPPADRGIHDPGQCRGGRGAGGAASGLHVPGARCAGPGKARRACAISWTRSAFPGWRWPRARSSGRSCSTASCARAAETPERAIVNELVLRSQAQAVYSPNNIGHFGLALPRYAHFTSPIRRYADLLVHRALVAGGAPVARGGRKPRCDRRAHLGDRAPRRGGRTQRARPLPRVACWAARSARFSTARITGVASFGVFVTLPEIGADGLVPISTLPSDYYDHDSARHRLVGRRTGRV